MAMSKKKEAPVEAAPAAPEAAPPSEKEELEALVAEMKRLGVHRLGEAEARLALLNVS